MQFPWQYCYFDLTNIHSYLVWNQYFGRNNNKKFIWPSNITFKVLTIYGFSAENDIDLLKHKMDYSKLSNASDEDNITAFIEVYLGKLIILYDYWHQGGVNSSKLVNFRNIEKPFTWRDSIQNIVSSVSFDVILTLP